MSQIKNKQNKKYTNKMVKNITERPVFPFTSIVGQEEICVL